MDDDQLTSTAMGAGQPVSRRRRTMSRWLARLNTAPAAQDATTRAKTVRCAAMPPPLASMLAPNNG